MKHETHNSPATVRMKHSCNIAREINEIDAVFCNVLLILVPFTAGVQTSASARPRVRAWFWGFSNCSQQSVNSAASIGQI
jgi:hypothetical protein